MTPGNVRSELPISPFDGVLVESLITGAPLTVKAKSAPEEVCRPWLGERAIGAVIPGSTCSVALVTPLRLRKAAALAAGAAPSEPALSITTPPLGLEI